MARAIVRASPLLGWMSLGRLGVSLLLALLLLQHDIRTDAQRVRKVTRGSLQNCNLRKPFVDRPLPHICRATLHVMVTSGEFIAACLTATLSPPRSSSRMARPQLMSGTTQGRLSAVAVTGTGQNYFVTTGNGEPRASSRGFVSERIASHSITRRWRR